MEKQQSRLTSDLYNKDCKGTLLPNKEIPKRKGRSTKLCKFWEDDETELVPKQLMNWAKENRAYRELLQNLKIDPNNQHPSSNNDPSVKRCTNKTNYYWLHCKNIPNNIKAEVVELYMFQNIETKNPL